MVTLFLRPRDRFMLCFEGGQYVVRMILYNIVVNVRALRPPLWPRLNVNICHLRLPSWIYPALLSPALDLAGFFLGVQCCTEAARARRRDGRIVLKRKPLPRIRLAQYQASCLSLIRNRVD
jgi:hypothetical protein